MNQETQISQLIARKITGVASEREFYEWKRFTENDPEMEQALEIIIQLWNAPGFRNQKQVDDAFRKISLRLSEKRATVKNYQQRKSGLLKFFLW